MVIFGKIGKLLKISNVKQINHGLSSVFQATRSMHSSKLFVEGLAYSTDETKLREYFARYGEVLEAKIIRNRETGRSRGFGFVTFATIAEASGALQTINISLKSMRNMDPNDRRMQVHYARERSSHGFGDYSVPGSYHGSHILNSYAADGEIRSSEIPARFLGYGEIGPYISGYDAEINKINGELKLLAAMKRISS